MKWWTERRRPWREATYWALDLGYPTTVEATSTPWGGDSDDPDSYPISTSVHYEFPRRGLMPPVDLHWYDGGLMPRRPEELPAEEWAA